MKLVLIFILFGLAACSTLTKPQCKAGKWLEIGLADSKNIRSEDFYKKHIEACGNGEFKEEEYKKGWDQGLPYRNTVIASLENPEVQPPTAEQLSIENENYNQVRALALGSVIGLGSGHVLQSRFFDRGWIFTLLEGGMLMVPVKGWVLAAFIGVKSYEVFDLSKYFYRHRLGYPDWQNE
jgi:hypothetical protein